MRVAFSAFERGLLLLLIALMILYALASIFAPAPLLIEIADSFCIPISFVVSWAYFRILWKRPDALIMTGSDVVMIGISGAWLVTGFDRIIRLWARLHDASVLDEPLLGLFLFMQVYFAALHIKQRGATAGTREDTGTRTLAMALIMGLTLATVVVYLRVN